MDFLSTPYGSLKNNDFERILRYIYLVNDHKYHIIQFISQTYLHKVEEFTGKEISYLELQKFEDNDEDYMRLYGLSPENPYCPISCRKFVEQLKLKYTDIGLIANDICDNADKLIKKGTIPTSKDFESMLTLVNALNKIKKFSRDKFRIIRAMLRHNDNGF